MNGWKLELHQGRLLLTDKRNQQQYPNILRLIDGGDEGEIITIRHLKMIG
ncbi:hypothetical protein AB6F62_09890 [Providencia huaxiensis]